MGKKQKPVYATVTTGNREFEFKFKNETLAKAFMQQLAQVNKPTIKHMLSIAAVHGAEFEI